MDRHGWGRCGATNSLGPLPTAQFLEEVDGAKFLCSGSDPALGSCRGPGLGALSSGNSAIGATGTVDVFDPSYGSLTISASASSEGNAAAEAAGYRGNADAYGEATYYLELVGPQNGGLIPLHADISMHVQVSVDSSDFDANAGAGAGMGIFKPNGQNASSLGTVFAPELVSPDQIRATDEGGCEDCVDVADFSGDLIYPLQPNVQYLVVVTRA